MITHDRYIKVDDVVHKVCVVKSYNTGRLCMDFDVHIFRPTDDIQFVTNKPLFTIRNINSDFVVFVDGEESALGRDSMNGTIFWSVHDLVKDAE